MQNIGALLADCLDGLEKDRSRYENLGSQFSRVVELAVLSVESDDSAGAVQILRRLDETATALCELGRKARQQNVELVISITRVFAEMIRVTTSRGAQAESPFPATELDSTLDSFISESIRYLDQVTPDSADHPAGGRT